MKPIGKYILIRQIKEEVKTESGLLLSADDVSQIRYKKADVVKPGTDVSNIKSNDVIYYDSRAGHTMVIKGEQYTIITERDVVIVE
jgi:co-chaperonin GroES (HSP10)